MEAVLTYDATAVAVSKAWRCTVSEEEIAGAVAKSGTDCMVRCGDRKWDSIRCYAMIRTGDCIWWYAMLGIDTAYGTGCLRAYGAMSGTGKVSSAQCYAMSGTDVAYGAMAEVVDSLRKEGIAPLPMVLRSCYAMSGTKIGYGTDVAAERGGDSSLPLPEQLVPPPLSSYVIPMQCPVLTYAMPLPGLQMALPTTLQVHVTHLCEINYNFPPLEYNLYQRSCFSQLILSGISTRRFEKSCAMRDIVLPGAHNPGILYYQARSYLGGYCTTRHVLT
eukprot:2678553-Rhodomonas_salina.2